MDNVTSDCSLEKRKKHYDLHLTTEFSRILIIKVRDLCSEAVIHTTSIQWQMLGYFFPLRDWHSSLKQTTMIGFIFVFEDDHIDKRRGKKKSVRVGLS